MPREFFISDTHFSHERIITFCNRPFDSVDEMNEVMIERWNETVALGDIVYHMGDVALGKIDESLPLIGRLNGYKILVPGNHDRIFSGEKESMRQRFFPEYAKYFQEIIDEIDHLVIADRVVILSHFPYAGDSQDNDRHVDKRPVDDGSFLIHGHIHDKRRIDGRMFNVGVDAPENNFYPISADEIVAWMDQVDKA